MYSDTGCALIFFSKQMSEIQDKYSSHSLEVCWLSASDNDALIMLFWPVKIEQVVLGWPHSTQNSALLGYRN